MFTKFFDPDSAMVRLDRNEAERLRQVFAADRVLRRERAQWCRPLSARCQMVLKVRS
jgi:hypothetical protein